MIARGNAAPSIAFSVEPIPKKPGVCLVRFYSNPRNFEKTRNGETVRGAEWDEYHLEVTDNGFVADMVEANYDYYRDLAASIEGTVPGATIEDRVDALENDVEQIITGLEALAV